MDVAFTLLIIFIITAPIMQGGVDVRLLVPGRPDHKIVWLAGLSYFPELLNAGVRIFQYDAGFVHAKTMVIDKKISFVGSFNFDQRSLHINNEIGMLFEDEKIGGANSQAFDENIEDVAFRVELLKDHRGIEALRWHAIEDGREVYFDNEPYAGWQLRAAVWFMKYLPIESML